MLLLLIGTEAVAQSRGLTVQVEPLATSARVGGPIPVVCKLHWSGAGLLDGHLLLILRDGNEVIGRVRVEGVVLSGGEQSLRAMLPPVASSTMLGELLIDVVFEGKTERLKLGEHRLRVGGEWQRWFAVCVCAPWDLRAFPALDQLAGGLRLETYYPQQSDDDALVAARMMSTSLAHVRPAEMPFDPLGYCAFNIVLLDPQGLADLREGQLRALREWVAAGGSLCVLAGGTPEPRHLGFLNELAADGPDELPILLDAQGQVMSSAGTEDRVRLVTRGLGRVAVITGSPEDAEAFPAKRWREVAAFLWHIRGDHRAALVRTGAWDVGRVRSATPDWDRSRRRNDRRGVLNLSPAPLALSHQLLTHLMPRNVEALPLWVMGLILGAFVLLIGPVDYFVLGFFRQRKLTWIVFPAVTVGVTLLTVWLSQWYMAGSDNRRSVTFRDVGDGGRVVRENRFELLFTGTPRTVRTELRHALLTPLDHQRLGGAAVDPRYAYNPNFNPRDLGLVGPATYTGRMPTQYAVVQEIPQWTPQPNRIFAIAPETASPAFDWDAAPPWDLLRGTSRSAVRQAVYRAFGPEASVIVFHRNETHSLIGRGRVFEADPHQVHYYAARDVANRSRDFLHQMSVRPEVGLFSIVARIAPGGSANIEDLALLDPSNPDQWLLVVAVPRGGELVIYRKLYDRSSFSPP